MISFLFYGFYFLISLSPIYLVFRKRINLILYPLLFTAQFNATSFVKLGVTISFFELSLFITTVSILVFFYLREIDLRNIINVKQQDFIWYLFISCAVVSMFIAFIRVYIGNLVPNTDIAPVFYLRSIMSLNKFLVYFPCFYVIRAFICKFSTLKESMTFFLKGMSLSGIIPVLAVLIQFFQLGFLLIHNNPSFSETFRVENYTGTRPVGLTNEASFFVYQLFFSHLALYHSWKKDIFTKKIFYTISFLYIIGVILSLSRTGMLIFALFHVAIYFREINFNSLKGLIKILKFIPIFLAPIFIISSLNVSGLNMGDRIISSFNQEADYSTIERYGSAEALLNLFIDKGQFFGIGIYNFQYYILDYLPTYMDVFYYPKGTAPSSFNFIFQLLVEFGFIVSLFFFFLARKNIFKSYNDRFFKDWFLFLLIFSFTFQTLNFSIPFLVFFFPSNFNEKNYLHN